MTAADHIRWGCEAPYDDAEAGVDPARRAALGVLNDLSNRRGICHALDDIDDEVRSEIVESLAAIVRESFAHSAASNGDGLNTGSVSPQLSIG